MLTRVIEKSRLNKKTGKIWRAMSGSTLSFSLATPFYGRSTPIVALGRRHELESPVRETMAFGVADETLSSLFLHEIQRPSPPKARAGFAALLGSHPQ